MSESAHAGYLARVSRDSWRKQFLHSVEGIAELEDIFSRSIETEASLIRDADRRRYKAARKLVRSYSEDELAVARHHYNSKHLVLYWRHFCSLLDESIRAEIISADFPLLLIQNSESGVDITSVDLGMFQGVSVVGPAGELVSAKAPIYAPEATIFRYQRLRALILKMQQLWNVISESAVCAYRQFLAEAATSNSEAWQCYKIHYFLDEFLCVNSDGKSARTPFSAVFLNSNFRELQVYLTHHVKRSLTISHDDVARFLESQRRYYSRIAIKAPIEDILLLNSRKDLLAYDPVQNVVRIRSVSSNIQNDVLGSIKKNYVEQFGYRDLGGGCPFAKFKGVKSNALIELYQRYDDLFLYVLKNTHDFEAVFNSKIH